MTDREHRYTRSRSPVAVAQRRMSGPGLRRGSGIRCRFSFLRRLQVVVWLLAGAGAGPVAAVASDVPADPARNPALPRWEATWADGTLSYGEKLERWEGDAQEAALGGRRLLKTGSPLRVLRNTHIPWRPMTGPFVEFIQGDVFPGQVFGQELRPESVAGPILYVRPGSPVDLPGGAARDLIRIHSGWVRRIVWNREPRGSLQPGTAFRHDGTSLRYQRLRMQADGFHLLTENQVVSLGWEELAELHFPASDWWAWHARELAALSADLQSPILRLAVDGMRLTTSQARFQIWNRGPGRPADESSVIVQPAWCEDVLCVPGRAVGQLTCCAATEVPLSVIEPVLSRHEAALSRLVSHWQRDANALGGPLFSGGRGFGWGIGTCGDHELEYPLTEAARRFTTRCGLDSAAGAGGCLRGRVQWTAGSTAPDYQLLHQTDLLIGSQRLPDQLNVDVPRYQRQARLRLVSDSAVDETPGGHDRWDMRDFCDWLEPRLELDRDVWQAVVASSLPGALPEFAAWTTNARLQRDWHPRLHWEPNARPYPVFQRHWELPGFPVVLRRTLKVPAQGPIHWRLRVYRASGDSAACRAEIRFDNRPAGRFLLAAGTPGEAPAPWEIDLTGFAGRELQVEVQLVPLAGKTRIVLAGADFAPPAQK